MNSRRPIDRPQLARGVRYRWDKLRRQHQLLFSEGMLELNQTGAAIVALCDGRSLHDLKTELQLQFDKEIVDEEVNEFLSRLRSKGLVRDVVDA